MKSKILVGSATLVVLLTVGAVLTPPAAAFHGAWWKGFGTATAPDGTVYNLEFYWGGQKAVTECAGGGCKGAGDGRITLTRGPVVAIIPFVGLEDVRNILFTNDASFCPSQQFWTDPLEVTPNYVLEYASGAISGIQRNCLSSGINRNDFAGSYSDLDLVVHAEGTFGVSHG